MKTGPCEWGSTVWITKCFPTNESSVFHVPLFPLPEGCGDCYQVPRPPTSSQPSWGVLGCVGSSLSPFFLLVLFSSTRTAHLSNHRQGPRPRPLEDDPPHAILLQPDSASSGREARPGVGRGLPAECEGPPAPDWGARRPNSLSGGTPGVAPWHPGWSRGARLAPSRLTNCSV